MFFEEILMKFVIAALGVIGFFVALHIYREKKAQRPLVCPINFDCEKVVHSDYSKFLGARVEVLGMTYYILVAFAYILLATVPYDMSGLAITIMALLPIVGFIFSVYLVGIQAFVIKDWCSWCLVSALDCAAIATLTLFLYDFHLFKFMF